VVVPDPDATSIGEFGSITGGWDAPAVLGSVSGDACGWLELLLSIVFSFLG